MKVARERLPMCFPELEVAMEVTLGEEYVPVVVGMNVDGDRRVDVVILLASSSLSTLAASAWSRPGRVVAIV